MHLEIELQSPNAKQELYELRNYLQENVPGLHLSLKELPPQEGEMGLEILLLEGVVEAVAGVTIHQAFDRLIKPKLDAWLQSKRDPKKERLEVLSTLKSNEDKVHFMQNNAGEYKVYDNVRYAIDTDKTRALLIGSSEFDSSFSAIPPVKGNLEDFYRLLIDKRHIGLPPENVTVALNKSNTEIEELLLHNSKLPNLETLLIYYAGHGHRTDVKKLYLTAKNTKKIDDYILGGIDFDFINNAVLKYSSAKQKIMIIDACYSGIATQGDGGMVPEVDVKGTYILTSSPGDEVSYFDKNGRNTHFTGVLLDVLRNGIDNSNEMLALDDIHDHTSERLQERRFPNPIAKSQLNIPASQFFIARNPSFSAEKLKRKPGVLFTQGRHQDALYEYEVLMQKYPDDLELRKEAEQCRSQVLFTQLVSEADELFYQYGNYTDALDKYRKALQVKSDDMVRHKISKCEERLKVSGQSALGENDRSMHTDRNRSENEKVVLVQDKPKPAQRNDPLKSTEKPNDEKQSHARKVLKSNQALPVVWLVLTWLVAIIFVIVGALYSFVIPAPMLSISLILFFWRGHRSGKREWLMYIFSIIPPLYLTSHVLFNQIEYWDYEFNHHYDSYPLLFAFLLTMAVFLRYYIVLKTKVSAFSTGEFILASIALIIFSVLAFATAMPLFLVMMIRTSYLYDASYIGMLVGLIVGIVCSILVNKKWRSVPNKPANPPSAS